MIFSCGEALVDLVPDPASDGASVTGGVPLPGGGPMNVAVAAARLGVESSFVGGVSTDAFGEMLWEHLLANGVDVSMSQRSDAPTAKAIVEHVPELRFRFEGVDTADTLLTDLDNSRIAGATNIVHGGTLGLFRGPTAETLARLAEQHDGVVSLDPNIRPQIIDDRARWDHFHERWLPHVDIYKGSDEDLEWIWPDRTPEQSAEWLIARGVSVVIVTRGSDGLQILTSTSSSAAAPPPIDVVDTVGAGDTIVGTVLASIAEHFDGHDIDLRALGSTGWQVFAERAVAAAAITCSRAGADTPLRSELPW